ncbi:hypothetical protein Q1695_001351 [Nippostrongylus brasiliensis]|nr:hypothetical protein Q1695_001351 [Nippostrongylus brasiliensis]
MLAVVQFLQSEDLQARTSTKLRSHGEGKGEQGFANEDQHQATLTWGRGGGYRDSGGSIQEKQFFCSQQEAQLKSNEFDWVFIPCGSHEEELFHYGIPSEFRANAIEISEICATFLLS